MSINDISSSDVIDYCFTPSGELDKRIDRIKMDFVKYSLSIKEGNKFNQEMHDSFLDMIKILTYCMDRQVAFLNEFLNGK